MSGNIVFRDRYQIERVQEKNFSEMMDLVFAGHPYYREILAGAKLSRNDFKTLADLARLPVTGKADYMAAPHRFRLEIEGLPAEMRVVWDVMYTAGTKSGQPTPFYSTTYDFFNILTLNRSMLEIRGVTERDLIANLFPLTVHPHGAFIRALHAASAMNIPVVSALPGNPSPRFRWGNGLDSVVAIVERSRATILWGVTSYVRRLLIRAGEMGADFSAVRLVFLTGEGVTEGFRADLVRRLQGLGAAGPGVSVSYGATEMQGGMVECRPGSGYHNPAPDQHYIEIVSPDTHLPVEDGTRGLILLTHLDRRGTVLLRYALGDVTVKTTARCPHCGSNTDRLLEMPRRADELVKIKGTLVNPAVIAEALSSEPGVTEYQIVVGKEDERDPYSMDRLTVRIAAPPPASDALRGRIAARVKEASGVTPIVEIVHPDQIYDPDRSLKARRFVDLRPPAD